MAKRAMTRGIPAEGAKPTAMPGFIKPQLATLKPSAPSGSHWLNARSPTKAASILLMISPRRQG